MGLLAQEVVAADDGPVVRFHDADGTLDDTLYYATDANMNVTALVDTSGTVQERYTYDAYGQVHIWDGSWTTRTSSSYDNQILFGGYRYDPETGLYYVDNRTYHPTLGRWTSREPFAADYLDGTNLYSGFGDAPITFVDPSGLYIEVESPSAAPNFVQQVKAALAEICPCVDIEIEAKDIQIARGPRVVERYRKAVVTASVSDRFPEQAEFCDCVDEHPAGCRLLRDLLTDKAGHRIRIGYTPIKNGGEKEFEGKEGYNAKSAVVPIQWNSGWSGGGIPGVPDTDYTSVAPADADYVRYAILAHELTHAWVTTQGIPPGEEGTRHTIGPFNPERSNQETWAVRAENQIFEEMSRHHGQRTTYGGRHVDDPTKPLFGPCKCKDEGWYQSLPWGGPAH